MDEFIGGDLYSHLQAAGDLVVIADEHHVYRTQAKAFSSAIRELAPRALIGLTATPDLAQEAHSFVRSLHDAPVLYGGSVKPENAAGLLAQPDVDGALVGGASLDPDGFAKIVAAAAP